MNQRSQGTDHFRLDDQIALVTGGGRGIGREIALELGRRGAHVVVASRDVAACEATCALLSDVGASGDAYELDLVDRTGPQRLVDLIVSKHGRLDVFVANSGIGGPSGPLWEIEDATWDETIEVNLTGTFRSLRAVVPVMISRHRGSVVVIGSITGKRPLLGRSPYAASKLGLVGLCRTLAADAGPYGVRVNVLSPGFVDGERVDWVVQRQAEARAVAPESVRRELENLAVVGRLVEAKEVAAAVAFLASDAASGITGVDLNVALGSVMY